MVTRPPLLTVEHLQISYGVVEAVRDLNLGAVPGEVRVVLGPNGAGKTSSMAGIVGLVKPSGGTVTLDGVRIDGRPAWKNVRDGLVLVPEGRQIVGPLTVEENLLLGGYTQSSTTRRDETLALVHELFPILADRHNQLGGLLSGGEQQMLAFGRALMAAPRVMLLDEPSMGLAPVIIDVVFESVRKMADRGIAIVMVEQNASALEIADTACVLERGEVVLEAPAAQLRDNPDVIQSFFGVKA